MRSCPSVPELHLNDKEVLVVRIGIPTASCDQWIAFVLIMLDLVIHREFHISVKIVVEPQCVARQRAVRTIGVDCELLVTIGRFKAREPRERSIENVLVPSSTPETVVMALDILALKF